MERGLHLFLPMIFVRPKNLALFTTLVSAAVTLGCGAGDEPDAGAAQAVATDGFTVAGDDPVDYQACERISEDVESLLASTMSCGRDEICSTVTAEEMLPDACLPSISCYVAVADPVELDPIRDELRDLDDEYREDCGLCPTVKCVPEDRIRSQCEAGSCDVESLPRARTGVLTAPTNN